MIFLYFRLTLNDVIDNEIEDPIYILPNDLQSDEESGDDEKNDVNNLPKRLLTTEVEIASESDISDHDDNNIQEPAKKKTKKIHSYSDAADEFHFEIIQEYSDWEPGNNNQPIDFFRLFFNDELIDFIYDMSKSYSGNDFTKEELIATLGVLVSSGVVSVTRRRDFWASSKLKKNLLISETISRNKFEMIFSKLHFIPVDAVKQKDKYQKVRILFSKLNKKFLEYAPNGNAFSIDEAMARYYGRHGCKQHIKGKPIRFGFKIWTLATPLGYGLWLEPYPGRAEIATEEYDYGSSGNVVYFMASKLRERYPEQDMSITVDNYFSGLPLFADVKEKLHINCTGTFRKNRIPNNPFDYKQIQKSERGTFDIKRHDETGTNLVCWNDNTPVTVGSNCVSSYEKTIEVKRYSKKSGGKIAVKCPVMVHHYNKTMGGVDRLDANVSFCRSSIRGKKWYYPLFIHLLDCSIANAWILYRMTVGKKDINTFRTEVAEALLSKSVSQRKVNTKPATSSRYDQVGHFVDSISSERRCGVCQKKTKYECIKCRKALHPKACFLQYHLP